MAKSQFKSIALDDLINSVTETHDEIDELTNDIANYDTNDVAAATNPAITNLVQKQSSGTTVDFERVYAQLERLIENGNTALTTINSFDIDCLSPEVISCTTSLINAIKNCMSEFTKIHLNHVKFIQKLKLMEVEQQYKRDLLAEKAKLYNSKNGNQSQSNEAMIQIAGDNFLNFIRYQEEQNKSEL